METANAFEISVEREVTAALQRGDLGLAPNSAQVFRGKKYYSRDRSADIVVDVSIEVFREGVDVPWLVWIWECKDYTSAVPVDDVEEFHAKLEQIGADKTKGTIITSSTFQSGAVAFAKAKGIGLVRRAPDGSTIFLLEAERSMTEEELTLGLTAPDTRRIQSLFYGLSATGFGFDSLDEYLKEGFRPD